MANMWQNYFGLCRLNYLKKKKHTVVLEINMVDVILCFSQDKMGNKRFYIRL